VDPSLYHRFFEVEDRHWWFVARQRIVLDLIGRRSGPGRGRPALDVGCGTGAFLKDLSSRWNAWGIDTSELAIEYARRRGLTQLALGTLEEFRPASGSFDLITALDVIEHIQDDVAVLRQMGERLSPGGMIIVTVPAHPWLWSAHDEINHHHRRYTRHTLADAVSAAGLQLDYLGYFNCLLFPLALVQRAVARLTGKLLDDGLTVPSGWLNASLRSVFALERHAVGRIPLPFGLSLIAVIRKS
jgi:SAM-dependent methyltransferase